MADMDKLDAGKLERAKQADLVTLPEGVKGTNCANCMYLAKDQRDYCQHPDLMLELWDGASRMTCLLWDHPGTKHADGSVSSRKALPVLDPEEIDRAKKADLITLPKGTKETNCSNCEYSKDGYCHNDKVDQEVTPRNCCNYWDSHGSKRIWKDERHLAPWHDDSNYRSIEGSDLYAKALSWLGSGSGGDLVKPPEWKGPKPEAFDKALSLLVGTKALPPVSPGHQPTLAVDLDGTLTEEGPKDSEGKPDLSQSEPRQGAKDAIQHFYDVGWRIIIWTCRDDYDAISKWLKDNKIPWHFINYNPDQPTDSPKVLADYYIDDRATRPDDWEKTLVEIDKASGPRQPLEPDGGYSKAKELAEKALPEMKELLSKLYLPLVEFKELDPGHLESRLKQPGGLILVAPLKEKERAEEKVETDYGGDWSRLFDMARASVAVDTVEQIHHAMGVLEKHGAHYARVPKDRFKNPTSYGYRDILVNYKLPSGAICEVQFHLKPMLVAREKERLAYDVARTIKAALKEEGRESMTGGEAAAVQHALDTAQEIFDTAWKECQQLEITKAGGTKQLPMPGLAPEKPQPPAVPPSLHWHKSFGYFTKANPPHALYSGEVIDSMGRRNCFQGGKKVACSPAPPTLPKRDRAARRPLPPTQGETAVGGIENKEPVTPEAGDRQITCWAIVFNKKGKILSQDSNQPYGGWLIPVGSSAGSKCRQKDVVNEVRKNTTFSLQHLAKLDAGEGQFSYELLYTEDTRSHPGFRWFTPDEIVAQIKEAPEQEWHERGMDILNRAIETAKGGKGAKSLRAKYKASRTGPTVTRPIMDASNRQQCWRDGRHVPCDQFGGEGLGWAPAPPQQAVPGETKQMPGMGMPPPAQPAAPPPVPRSPYLHWHKGLAKAIDHGPEVKPPNPKQTLNPYNAQPAPERPISAPQPQEAPAAPIKAPTNQQEIIQELENKFPSTGGGTGLAHLLRERGITKAILSQFEGAGVDSLQDLVGILNKKQDLVTPPVNLTVFHDDNSPFVVLSQPQNTIKQGGVPAVVVDPQYQGATEDLAKAFPGVRFVVAEEVPQALEKAAAGLPKPLPMKSLAVPTSPYAKYFKKANDPKPHAVNIPDQAQKKPVEPKKPAQPKPAPGTAQTTQQQPKQPTPAQPKTPETQQPVGAPAKKPQNPDQQNPATTPVAAPAANPDAMAQLSRDFYNHWEQEKNRLQRIDPNTNKPIWQNFNKVDAFASYVAKPYYDQALKAGASESEADDIFNTIFRQAEQQWQDWAKPSPDTLSQQYLENMWETSQWKDPSQWQTPDAFASDVAAPYLEMALEAGLSQNEASRVFRQLYDKAKNHWTREKLQTNPYHKPPIDPHKPIQERIKSYTTGSELMQAYAQSDKKHLATAGKLQEARVQSAMEVIQLQEAYYRKFPTTPSWASTEGERQTTPEAKAAWVKVEEAISRKREAEEAFAKVLQNRKEAVHKLLYKHLAVKAKWGATADNPEVLEQKKEEVNGGVNFLRKVFANGPSGPPTKQPNVKLISKDDTFQRPNYFNGKISLQAASKTDTMVHEYGHYLEETVPGVKEAVQEFLAYRVGNEKPVSMKEKFPLYGYGENEYGRGDEFESIFPNPANAHYMGKVYESRDGEVYATEVVSMLLEKLYREPAEFIRAAQQSESARECLNFILGICDGSLRK